MTEDIKQNNSVAPLRNVVALVELIDRVNHRGPGLPGLGVFYGWSGYGKTTAAIYAANRFRAYQVEVKSVWTKKKLCTEILRDMGVIPTKTISDMVDQIATELARNDRPLIIDEIDHLVDRNMIEIVRDIHESSGATIILIGEEQLPRKLMRWERVHGRILDWVAAEEGQIDDVGYLADIYCPGITIDDDLIALILEDSHRSIRRISINLERVKEFAMTRSMKSLTRKDWGDRPLFTGQAPTPRRTPK
jgi:chromosomal replication initiation ATPase DnaA